MLGAGYAGRAFAQPKDFKIGLFIALSGPASLFGPTQRACADLAAEKINKAGGIMGRQIKLIFTDAGGPPAETAKSAVRLMLEDKVDLFIGSHDSATREAKIATIKGKVAYIYTPVYEGGECSPNIYCLGETPEQQVQPATEFLAKDEEREVVLPDRRRLRLAAQVERAGQEIHRRERRQGGRRGVCAVRRAQQVRGGGDAHQVGQAGRRAVTLVGADNVNFNRTFAGFGLDKSIARLSLLLEENTLMGIGADNSGNLYSCMGYFANSPRRGAKKFKAAYLAKFGDKAPQLGDDRRRLLLGAELAKALFDKAGAADAKKLTAASEGLTFESASGPVTMRGRQVDKTCTSPAARAPSSTSSRRSRTSRAARPARHDAVRRSVHSPVAPGR